MLAPDDDGDSDVSETGLVGLTPSGPVVVCGTHMGDVDVTGTYRLRVHARHRDEGEDYPVEQVLIQVWTARQPDTTTVVHKTTSRTGALWREPS
ncbi:hypothetical protein [Streptomyces sp. NPDC046727]|uniref:hypothetical protein n=1 Tax=Streptomyces sp. NPDC046727 TaxID=3155373 RepID=UPI0033F2B8B2